ncbi:MAG: calcium/sodium antiporter [Bacteroidales bacterium]
MSTALISLIFIAAGILLLVKGADWFVKGSSALAKRINMSELAIGLTVVAFGTSAPELIVNVFAAAENHPEIVLANVLGSNNINLFIILGAAGVIAPLQVQSSTAWKEIPFSIFVIFILLIFTNDWFISSEITKISRIEGALLLVLFILFLLYVYKQLAHDPHSQKYEGNTFSLLKTWSLIIVGLAALIAGGKIIVSNAVDLARHLQISEKIIGITIIALGTSLPELATSVVAAFKRNTDIAVGNIIGSNIFNLLLVIPVSALIRPINFSKDFNTDIYILAGGTLFLFLAMYTGKIKRLDRWEASILLVFYVGYMISLVA